MSLQKWCTTYKTLIESNEYNSTFANPGEINILNVL